MDRDYSKLMADMAAEYEKHSPKSAKIHRESIKYLVDGGSHAIRLMEPFTPRIARASGAWIEDEDGHRILDFWQGHYANILGHNPKIITDTLRDALKANYGLQSGFTDRFQVEAAQTLCRQTGQDRVRFTTSGTLATMYAIILARAYTGRELVLKVGGGWHGAHPWGLKGVGWHEGFEAVESEGIPRSVTDQVKVTGYNKLDQLEDQFRRYGEKLCCFIVEPVIGGGGMMAAKREYLEAARKLCDTYGVVLIFDEVISGFRFRAGDAGQLYGVKADLLTMGKAIGGGMPVAAVLGQADIMSLVGRARGNEVKFSGGTYAAHAGSMLAAKTYMNYLVENETQIYSNLAAIGTETRKTVKQAFASEDIHVRFAGDGINNRSFNSLHMLLFPYRTDLPFDTPEQVFDPSTNDQTLRDTVIQLAFIIENIHVVHGLGCSTVAHNEEDIRILGEVCVRVARRIKPAL